MFKLTLGVVIFILSLILGIWLFSSYVSFSNQEKRLRNQFNQKTTERTAFYDKMWKTLNQKGQIALRNDSSFRKNIDIIMNNRKDGEGIMFKWITESNPNANYQEVSALYKDLSRSVEAEREGFFNQEKVMQAIKQEHDNLLDLFPGSLFLFNREKLIYKPITSDRTDRVMETGKDNDVKVFE